MSVVDGAAAHGPRSRWFRGRHEREHTDMTDANATANPSSDDRSEVDEEERVTRDADVANGEGPGVAES
jgi:hypothetical protein